MKLGILCHTGAGGSGVLATELALAISNLGHDVHIIGEQPPFRINGSTPAPKQAELYRDLGETPPIKSLWGQLVELARRSFAGRANLSKPSEGKQGKLRFHELLSYEYPLFEGSPMLTLRVANTLGDLIERHKIELVNAHYAIPHSTAAILARESGLPIKVITTLHGTDVTRVGCDRAFTYTTRHAINSSDAVTAVSKFLVDEAARNLSITRRIKVIPNWVDSARFVRITDPKIRAKYAQPEEALILHVSNFRKVKRPLEVIKIFAGIAEQISARLILVGEGPEKSAALELAASLGLTGRILVLAPTAAIEAIMGIADVLLLPSEIEAAPLVILEAMASGAVPIASNVGGVSDLIEHGRTGFMYPLDDLNSMAAAAIEVIRNREQSEKMRSEARRTVESLFCPEKIIPQYLALYHDTQSSSTLSAEATAFSGVADVVNKEIGVSSIYR